MSLHGHYTTIVVGAGPAGVMAAYEAAKRGSVLLAEAGTLPRDKSCGGMLNEYTQAFFADRRRELPQQLFSDPAMITFRYFDWDRNIRRPTTLRFANVKRAAFDAWLMEMLPDNVDVATKTRLFDIDQDINAVYATFVDSSHKDKQSLNIECSYLIGCDGPRSTVRRALPVSQLSYYKTLQDYVPLKGEIEPFFDCVYARGIGSSYGYGYIIAKDKLAIVGSVFYPATSHNLPCHKKAVALYSSYYPYELEPVKREAWTAVQVRKVNDIVGGWGRVLVAGEAGAIMSPTSGEGISFALNSGTLAGRCVAGAHDNATRLGKSVFPPEAESAALHNYRTLLLPIKKNIARRLRLFPILNSYWGKWLGAYVPTPLLDKLAHII